MSGVLVSSLFASCTFSAMMPSAVNGATHVVVCEVRCMCLTLCVSCVSCCVALLQCVVCVRLCGVLVIARCMCLFILLLLLVAVCVCIMLYC